MNPYLFSIVLLIGLAIEVALYVILYTSSNNPYNVFNQL
ncbi:hypothetical protein [Acidianus bottle-shaped virus 3 strain ABV3]|uniref:Uncharacterized protein n=1 Tax=Acidianus bottle-shaped virus 3 strain ABV3 TaxID=1732174 RepID=A0A0N9P6I8_9VIRU|nr:hypothetical protein AVU00_gp46 [Acidianus bottle-shaped virus 3 strain ABV3]ALG96848.1 hypothetical protein [Acidianus bottle-shaped virus 3 strain ABV3]